MALTHEIPTVRVQYAVYPTREAALTAGWPDAEYGEWQHRPSLATTAPGWIALTWREEAAE